MAEYSLPHLSFAEQASLIHSRGIGIDDPEAAQQWLRRIGYYRLRPYWRALECSDGKPLPGAKLAHAVDLYRFDMRLRNCLFSALERIEVSLRVEVSHALGRRDPLGHRMSQCLDARQLNAHPGWLSIADRQLEECREQWLTDFLDEWEGPVPTWMAVEAWSFSVVSRLYQILHQNDRAAIASQFKVNPQTFASWMRACATVRNSCAHHSRLWNKPLIDQPIVPKTWEAKDVQHIGGNRQSETRVYAIAAVSAYLLQFIGGSSSWKSAFKEVVNTFPDQCQLSLSHAGFPADWQNQAIWQ